jgi:hypothetical protein
MQIVDDPCAVADLVRRRARVDVIHSVTHGIVEENRYLARGGGDRLGFADTRREPPVEGAQGRVGSSDRHCG